MLRVIGIGEYAVTKNIGVKIKTYALSSCVAVTAYSYTKKVGGMIHIALPTGNIIDMDKRPGYYAETGVPLFINKICGEGGCLKNELYIQIFGGASSINERDIFNIGKRNIEGVGIALNKLNIRIHKAHVEGKVSRTIELDIATGSVYMETRPIII